MATVKERNEQNTERMWLIVERSVELVQKNPALTKSEAKAIVEREMVLEERKGKGIVPITPELRQALKDAGLTVSGEAHNALNVSIIPGSPHLTQLGREGEVSKAAVKARLMETILYISKVARVLEIDLAPETAE